MAAALLAVSPKLLLMMIVSPSYSTTIVPGCFVGTDGVSEVLAGLSPVLLAPLIIMKATTALIISTAAIMIAIIKPFFDFLGVLIGAGTGAGVGVESGVGTGVSATGIGMGVGSGAGAGVGVGW